MESTSTKCTALFQFTAFFVSLGIILTLLILAKSFLIPIAWALLFTLASFRMLNRLEQKFRINRLLSSLLFVVLLYLVLIILFYFLYREILSIINEFPSFTAQLQESIQQGVATLENYGIHISPIDLSQIHIWITEHSYAALTSLGKTIGHVVLSGVYLFFMLFYRDNYTYYLKLSKKSETAFLQAQENAKQIAGVISSFLSGIFKTTLILSLLLYGIFLVIGLKFALFFAVLVALVSLIPYIGPPAGMTTVVLFALVSGDGLALPLMALAGMFLAKFLEGYVFRPIILGSKINLNAFILFISTIIGGLIWGISGMILFIPFTGIAKVLLERNEKTKPLVALFTTLPKNLRLSVRKTTKENQTEG